MSEVFSMRIVGAVAALGLLLAAAAPLAAQEARSGADKATEAGAAQFPAPVAKGGQVTIGGEPLAYTVRTGTLTLRDEDGKPRADIVFFAYTVDGAGKPGRPVTFAVNGGPGAASVFLHLGAVGPKILPLAGDGDLRPSNVPVLVDNADTWLDFTDLVFLDPVGTGWSRAAAGVNPKDFWTVESDARALAEAVRLYLTQNDRRGAPVFLLGESYGGFRGPLVANILRKDKGVGVSGLVLASPVLDFAAMSDNTVSSPIRWAARVPTLAALKLGALGAASRADLAPAEAYASGDYLVDVMKGPRDKAAVARIAGRLADLTGLDRAELERLGGHLERDAIEASIRARTGRIASMYDAGVLGLDPDPTAVRAHADDAVLDAVTPMLDAAMARYARDELGYVLDRPYEVLNTEVNRRWDFGGRQDAPEVVSDLREMLAIDPKLRVLVVHGYADLVTPYFASKMILDQLPAIGAEDRVGLDVLPGGHMFYMRPQSRRQFHAAAEAMYAAALD